MTSPPVRHQRPPLWRKAALWVFYSLPKPVKRRIVRIAMPTYTLGSVVLVFDEPREHLLMLLQPPGKAWTLPAGLMERREEPIDAALRELREETGIDAGMDEIQPATPNAVVHTYGRWVDNVFVLTRDPDETELAVDGSEVWDIGWHPVDELPLMTRSTANLLRYYGLGPRANDESEEGPQ